MSQYCSICNNWIVRGAAFCHTCGHPVAIPGATFETGLGGPGGRARGQAGQLGPASMRHTTPISEHVLRIGTLFLGGLCGHLFLEWDPSLTVILPLGYVFLGPAAEFIGTLAGKLPAMEFGQTGPLTLRVEHHETSDEGRRFVGLYDMPDSIGLEHLQWIAGKVLPPPDGEGESFSRRQVCKVGRLSQLQFETVRDAWLKINYAFYRNPAAPQQGIVLTPRCMKMLKRAHGGVVVAGYAGQKIAQLTTS